MVKLDVVRIKFHSEEIVLTRNIVVRDRSIQSLTGFLFFVLVEPGSDIAGRGTSSVPNTGWCYAFYRCKWYLKMRKRVRGDIIAAVTSGFMLALGI